MKKLLYLSLVLISMTSCVNLENICKTSTRINGEVIYAIPTRNYTRKVTILTTNNKLKVIYLVPLEQPLTNIPVCEKSGKLYWVMP